MSFVRRAPALCAAAVVAGCAVAPPTPQPAGASPGPARIALERTLGAICAIDDSVEAGDLAERLGAYQGRG